MALQTDCGTTEIKRNDIIVFNFPAGDTLIVGSENPDYYSQIRTNARIFQAQDPGLSREQAEKLVREKMWERFEITTRPVDKRENYIKRGVGCPGYSGVERRSVVCQWKNVR